MRHADDVECWRTSGLARWGTLVVHGGFSILAPVDNAVNGHSWLDGSGVSAVLMTLCLFTVRPSVRLHPGEVVVRNPLRTHHIPLAAVRDAEPGYGGVVIRREDRRLPVTAWAVQQDDVATAVGADTRAQQVAERIRQAAARADGERTRVPGSEVQPTAQCGAT